MKAKAKPRVGARPPNPVADKLAADKGHAANSKPPPSDAPAPTATKVDDKTVARQLFQARKFREAADAYRRATQANSADAGAFAGLGASLLAAGDARGAVAAYLRAVQLQPRVSGFHAALGRAYLVSGDRARARASYSLALELHPSNQAARTGLAYRDFADTLLGMPIPPSLDEADQRQAYCDVLYDQIDPVLAQATQVQAYCESKAEAAALAPELCSVPKAAQARAGGIE